MSTALEVLDHEPPDHAQLIRTARTEHELALQTGQTMVEHAIRAGGALFELKKAVPAGHWIEWLREHRERGDLPFSVGTANLYMRAAWYEEDARKARGVGELRATISHLPSRVSLERPPHAHPDWMRNEARALRDTGMSYGRIAEELGCAQTAVMRWIVPGYAARVDATRKDRRRRQLAAEKALAANEREFAIRRAVKDAGPGVSELYADIHKLTQKADKVIENASSKELRAGLNAALNRLHQARDEIVKAVGLA